MTEKKIEKKTEKKTGIKILADNRQARFQYEFLEVFEAGLVLTGTEVKSIRAGKINLRDSYGLLRNGEAWLLNAHISAHATTSTFFNHEPTRTRKLLMHKKEIRELIGSVDQQGLTLVPVKMYLKEGRVKISIALARGKKLHDKRDDLRKKDDQRDMARAMKQHI
jgi:SsrA-binding protein